MDHRMIHRLVRFWWSEKQSLNCYLEKTAQWSFLGQMVLSIDDISRKSKSQRTSNFCVYCTSVSWSTSSCRTSSMAKTSIIAVNARDRVLSKSTDVTDLVPYYYHSREVWSNESIAATGEELHRPLFRSKNVVWEPQRPYSERSGKIKSAESIPRGRGKYKSAKRKELRTSRIDFLRMSWPCACRPE